MLHIPPHSSTTVHAGSIYSRSGICEWGGPSGDLSDCESLVARILSDGKPYLCILQDSEGHSYKQRFSTRLGFVTALLPFNRFRAEDRASPPLRPGMITTIKFRCATQAVACHHSLLAPCPYGAMQPLPQALSPHNHPQNDFYPALLSYLGHTQSAGPPLM